MTVHHPDPLSLVHRAHVPTGNVAAHPTVICLHGRGSHEADLLSLAPHMDERLLWISPRAPLTLGDGFEWYRLEEFGVPNQATFESSVAALRRFITEAVSAYPVDQARLFLLGFSQGGMMAYSIALTKPARVAGVIAHSSYIPLNNINAAFTMDEAGLKDKPFLIAHGAHDPLIPVELGRQARDTLADWGAAVEYHEFSGGHHVNESSLEAMRDWLRFQSNLPRGAP